MKNKFIYLIILSTVCFAGCFQLFQSPKLLSFRDPAFSTTTYSRIMIVVDIPDWQQGYKIEQRFVDLLQSKGVRALSAIKFMPPTRTWTEDQRDQVMKANSIDGMLRITISAEGTNVQQVPIETTTTHKKEKEVTKKGDTVTVDKSITETQGGYTTEVPWKQYDIKMIDAASGKTAWITSATDKQPLESMVVDALMNERMLK